MAPIWIPTLALLLVTLHTNAAPAAEYPTEVVEDKVLLSQMEDMMKHMATLMQQMDAPENYVDMPSNMLQEAGENEDSVDCGGVDHFGKCSLESHRCPISFRKDGYYVCEHGQWILMFCPLGTIFDDGECEARDTVVKKQLADQLIQQNSPQVLRNAPLPVAYMELPQLMQNMLNSQQLGENMQNLLNSQQQPDLTDVFTYNPSAVLVSQGPCERASYRPYSGDASFYEECMRGRDGKPNYWLRRQCPPGTQARDVVGAGGLPCGYTWQEDTTPEDKKTTSFQMPDIAKIYSNEDDEEYEDSVDEVIEEVISTTQEITTGHPTEASTVTNTEASTYSTAQPTSSSTTTETQTMSTAALSTSTTPATVTSTKADTTTTELTTTTTTATPTTTTQVQEEEPANVIDEKSDEQQDILAELKFALDGVAGNIDLDSIDLDSIVSDDRPQASKMTNQGAGEEKDDEEPFQLPFVFNMEDVMLWPGGVVAEGVKTESEKDNADQSAEFILKNLPKNSELPDGQGFNGVY